MAAISATCKEWGFFQVVNYGVPLDLVEMLRGGWRAFFQLPMEEKYYTNSPKTYEGYGSRLGVEKDVTLDWCDYFFLHVLPENSRSPHKWPSKPQQLRGIIEVFSREVVTKVCETLMKALSMGLGLKEGRAVDRPSDSEKNGRSVLPHSLDRTRIKSISRTQHKERNFSSRVR